MRITELHLQNIGVFENETIVFQEKVDPSKAEIHIFTGKNGTGKSTLLYALASMQLIDPNFVAKGVFTIPIYSRCRFADSRTHWQISFNNKQVIDFQRDMKEVFKTNSNIHFLKEYFEKQSNFYGNHFDYCFLAYSGNRNAIPFYSYIDKIQEITKNPFEDILSFEKPIESVPLIQWIANQKTKQALAFMNSDHEKANLYNNNVKRIEHFISEVTNLQVTFLFEDNPFLRILIKIENQNLELNSLPDGLKSMIAWIGDLLMRLDRIFWESNTPILERNFILFLDEIEVHLHPAWQRKILPVVQKLFPNAQIFISTHSPFVVGSVDNAWVYKLEGENGTARVTDVSLSSASKSYQVILDEVFDIKEEFGEEVEQEFKQFYALKSAYLKKDFSRNEEFRGVIHRLLNRKSLEIENIIGLEIRQLERQTQTKIEL